MGVKAVSKIAYLDQKVAVRQCAPMLFEAKNCEKYDFIFFQYELLSTEKRWLSLDEKWLAYLKKYCDQCS